MSSNSILIQRDIGSFYTIKLSKDYNIKAIQQGIWNILEYLKFEGNEFQKCIKFIQNNFNLGEFIFNYVLKNIEKFSNKNLIRMKSEFIIECFKGHMELISQLNSEAAIEWYVENQIREHILKVNSLTLDLEDRIRNI